MYLDFRYSNKHSGYVYIRRGARDGDKVITKVIAKLGLIDELNSMSPDMLDRLKDLCRVGSIEPFKAAILNHDLKLSLALDNLNSDFKEAHNAYQLLERAKTSLSYQDQLLLINVYAQDLNEHQDDIDKLNQKVDEALLKEVNQAKDKASAFKDVACNSNEPQELASIKPPYDCLVDKGLIDAVIVAAGVGSRMGANVPKQYLTLGDKTILEQTVMKFLCCPYISRVIVVISQEDPYFKKTCLNDLQDVTTVFGGKERVDSVLNGLQEVKTRYCLVHDAARPLFLMRDIENLLLTVASGLVEGYCGGILCSKVADTLKLSVCLEQEFKAVDRTVDRSYMYRAQTPQLFQANQLIYAITKGLQEHKSITDEASALEHIGQSVQLVEGSALNFKITDKSDLLMANAIWNMI